MTPSGKILRVLVRAVERRKLILRVRGTVIKVCFGVLCLSSLSIAALVSLGSCMGQPLSGPRNVPKPPLSAPPAGGNSIVQPLQQTRLREITASLAT